MDRCSNQHCTNVKALQICNLLELANFNKKIDSLLYAKKIKYLSDIKCMDNIMVRIITISIIYIT